MPNTLITDLYPKPTNDTLKTAIFEGVAQNDVVIVAGASKIIEVYSLVYVEDLIIRADAGAVFDLTGKNALTLNTGVTTTVGGVNASYGDAIAFDGINGRIAVSNDGSLTLGLDDFTVECWVFINNHKNYNTACCLGSSGLIIQFNSTGSIRIGRQNVAVDIAGPVVTVGQWYHFAVTRDNGILRLFVNGAFQGSKDMSSVPYSAGTFYIGSGAGIQFLDGKIDDFIITKGVAKYVSNFTPPSTPIQEETGWRLITPNTDWDMTDATVEYPKADFTVFPQGQSVRKLIAGTSDLGVVYI